ncbi:MAG: ATP-dependent Clp protease adaptor ClpS [Alphaproteobacteria bacterium]|nr:MAG: ATP-dependent Clp protease adaptor ClpS [Alphaproteobacteria bacterium]
MSDKITTIKTPVKDPVQDTIPKAEPPKKWNVIFLNDDYTPMDFVVDMMMDHFNMTLDTAMNSMFDIHRNGKGLVGEYPHEIAEHKCNLVMGFAVAADYPLRLIYEPCEG